MKEHGIQLTVCYLATWWIKYNLNFYGLKSLLIYKTCKWSVQIFAKVKAVICHACYTIGNLWTIFSKNLSIFHKCTFYTLSVYYETSIYLRSTDFCWFHCLDNSLKCKWTGEQLMQNFNVVQMLSLEILKVTCSFFKNTQNFSA